MSFMIVVIIIGVPMWWKTTEVYRASLPAVEILELSERPIEISIKIGVFSFDEQKAKSLVDELRQLYKENDIFSIDLQHIATTDKASSIRTPVALEAHLLSTFPLRPGDFMFIEWPRLQEEVLLTTERSALIRPDIHASKLQAVLDSVVLQSQRLRLIMTTDEEHSNKIDVPQAEYDVVISVVNPRPETMDVHWNVQKAVEIYVRPFLNEVSHISNYTIKTQWNYQAEFEADWKQVRDQSKIGRHYALQESALPHIITSIENYLGRGITNKTTLNLVVYVPPCEIAPVHIYSKYGEQLTRNNVDSFISPKWGGIIIANPPIEACLESLGPERTQVFIPTNDIMQIMLDHLHKLLDIEVSYRIEGVKNVGIEEISPRRWEYDAYIRRSAITHVITATNTLQSLVRLLDNISYIVINDAVGAAINEAYEKIVQAKEAFAIGDMMRAAEYARSAFVASEQAFFDPSLLAQLYFPDEQKYAIYIPLFLPIMAPVITSFTMTRQLLMKFRNAGKPKTD